jgi:hypothetical protein
MATSSPFSNASGASGVARSGTGGAGASVPDPAAVVVGPAPAPSAASARGAGSAASQPPMPISAAQPAPRKVQRFRMRNAQSPALFSRAAWSVKIAGTAFS